MVMVGSGGDARFDELEEDDDPADDREQDPEEVSARFSEPFGTYVGRYTSFSSPSASIRESSRPSYHRSRTASSENSEFAIKQSSFDAKTERPFPNASQMIG